ncbi:MAG: helix-turn-helix domain-containing protein [Firmicutes bacterium]|nr:helix-turn-helix domain-containing protein [Bacillota bacterium]
MLKRIFLKFLSIGLKKSHYRKMLLFYSVFTLSIITTSSFILISYFNNALSNEAKVSNLRLLTQIRVYSDTMLRESVYSLINRKFVDICSDKNVFDFFSDNQPNNLEVLNRLYRDLWLIATNNNIIESIYVYRKTDNTLVSSKEGICISVSASEDTKRQYVNFKLIEEMMLSSARNRWISPIENRDFWGEQPIISFVVSVPLLASESNVLGVVIDRVIKNLSERVNEMEETIRSNQGIIRYKIAMDIINGSISGINELNERLKVVNDGMPYDSFCIIITEMDGRSLNLLSPEQREYELYKTIEIISDIFCRNCKHLSVSANPKRIVTVINFDNYNYIRGNLPTLLQMIRMHTGMNCNIALSEKTDNIFNLRNLFERSEALLNYSFIYNYGNVFIQDIIDNLEKDSKIFDFSLLDNIATLLKSCKISAAKEEVVKIFTLIRTENYTYDHVQSIIIQLIGLFCKIIKEQDIDAHIDRNSIFSSFNEITSLDECQQWILQLIDVYEESVSIRNSSIDTEFINKIVTFISGNIESQLTLNSVAKEFKISPNYLSKIFKVGTGVNFSEFLIQKKLHKAKELLLADRKTTVDDIAKRLGYFNTTYFISLFKENFGITPAKFRKRNLL